METQFGDFLQNSVYGQPKRHVEANEPEQFIRIHGGGPTSPEIFWLVPRQQFVGFEIVVDGDTSSPLRNLAEECKISSVRIMHVLEDAEAEHEVEDPILQRKIKEIPLEEK